MKRRKVKKSHLVAYGFILPAFIIHLCIITLPSLSTLVMSLFDWNGLGKAEFIGFDNFVEIFTKDSVVKLAVIHNLEWLAVFVTVPLILGFIVAILVSRIKRFQMFLRTVYFMPYVISLSIAPIFPGQYAHGRRISCDVFGTINWTEYMLNSLSYGWWA